MFFIALDIVPLKLLENTEVQKPVYEAYGLHVPHMHLVSPPLPLAASSSLLNPSSIRASGFVYGDLRGLGAGFDLELAVLPRKKHVKRLRAGKLL
jgi:hypothetical protein